jgi:restriction endonuclease S subunit
VSDGHLPGWSRSKLADLILKTLGGDWGKSPEEFLDGRDLVLVHVIRGTEVKFWQADKGVTAARRALKVSSLTKRRLQAGDIIVEVSGGGPSQPVARTILIDEEALERAECPLVCSNFFRLVRLHPELNPTFVEAQLRFLYFKGAFNEFQTQTTNLRNLNFGRFVEDTEMLIAPLNEQRRIVAKLEKLLDKVDSCQKRLAKIPILLKRFRQAVLAAACSGRLTEDWREAYKADGLTPPDNSLKPAGLFEVPDSWQWLVLQDLCDPSRSICYGVIKLGAEHPHGIPCLRTSDVKSLRIEVSKVKRISPSISNQYTRTLLRGGEVLVNVRGTLGGVAAVPGKLRGWNISREVALVPIVGAIQEFIAFWVASNTSQVWLTEKAKGVAYTGINLEDLRLLPVAVPPLSEQQEIVRRVDELFAFADQIETRFAKAKQYVDGLKQSVLAKAFRGELVPQDANDEPASALLERIREARATHQADRSRRRVTKSGPPAATTDE